MKRKVGISILLGLIAYFYNLLGIVILVILYKYNKRISATDNYKNTKRAILVLVGITTYKLFLEWIVLSSFFIFFTPLIYLVGIILFLIYLTINFISLFKKRNKDIKLALSLNLASIIFLIVFPFTMLSLAIDFYTKLPLRALVVSMVENEHLQPNVRPGSSLIKLPFYYPSLSAGGNEFTSEEGQIFFYTFRGLVDNYSGFMYTPTDDTEVSAEDVLNKIKLWKHWYFLAFT